MKVLFLDIDGVLNSKQFDLVNKRDCYEPLKSDIDVSRVRKLQEILDSVSDLKIVISSSWRGEYSVEKFREIFLSLGLESDRIIDKTSDSIKKSLSIKKWIMENPVDKYVVLDDDFLFDLDDECFNSFLKIQDGLTAKDVLETISKLK